MLKFAPANTFLLKGMGNLISCSPNGNIHTCTVCGHSRCSTSCRCVEAVKHCTRHTGISGELRFFLIRADGTLRTVSAVGVISSITQRFKYNRDIASVFIAMYSSSNYRNLDLS